MVLQIYITIEVGKKYKHRKKNIIKNKLKYFYDIINEKLYKRIKNLRFTK
jgi:hypothetical protein